MARTNHLKSPKKTSVIHHPWLRVAAVGCWRSPCCGRSRPGWRRGAWLCDWVGSLHCGAPPAPERRSLERPGEKCPLTGPFKGPKCWWNAGEMLVTCWGSYVGCWKLAKTYWSGWNMIQEAMVFTRASVLTRNFSVEIAEQFFTKKSENEDVWEEWVGLHLRGGLKQLCAFFSNNRSSLKHRSSLKSVCKNGQTKNQQLALRSWQLGSEENGDYGLVKQKWTSAVLLGKVSILRVRLLKASDTIRLWISMFEKKTEVETANPNGQGWIRILFFFYWTITGGADLPVKLNSSMASSEHAFSRLGWRGWIWQACYLLRQRTSATAMLNFGGDVEKGKMLFVFQEIDRDGSIWLAREGTRFNEI